MKSSIAKTVGTGTGSEKRLYHEALAVKGILFDMISLACNCCLHGFTCLLQLDTIKKEKLKSQAQTLSPLAPVLVQVPALSSVQLGFFHLQNFLAFFFGQLALPIKLRLQSACPRAWN
ncbi:hypothetical protein AMTRI_Chr05g69910 [Amborella trichopoda]